jgi:hypothetical protein
VLNSGIEPVFELADDVVDVVGAHLPLDGCAALIGECRAVICPVVDEDGVSESDFVPGEPGAEKRPAGPRS